MTSGRFGAACALLVAVAFFAGLALLDLPGHDDDDSRLNEFYGDSGNRLRIVLGAYSWAISGIALLGLGAVLSARAAAAGAAIFARLILSSGVAAAVLLIAAAAAQSPTYAGSIDAFDEPQSELARATIPHIGWSLLNFSMLCAAIFVGATTAALRATGLPRWLLWPGIVATAGLPLSILFMPLLLFPIWMTAVAFGLWLSPPVSSDQRQASVT